ncbi:MAG: hypothetical protein ACRCXZ_06505 [Patescibacteria group bacterium]
MKDPKPNRNDKPNRSPETLKRRAAALALAAAVAIPGGLFINSKIQEKNATQKEKDRTEIVAKENNEYRELRAKQDKYILANQAKIEALVIRTAGEYNVQMANNTRKSADGEENLYKKRGLAYQYVDPGYSLTAAERALLSEMEKLDLTPSPILDARHQKEIQPFAKGTGPGEEFQDSGKPYTKIPTKIFLGLPGEKEPGNNEPYLDIGRKPKNYG